MIKLANILNEVKVQPPLNKRKAFVDMRQFSETMLVNMIPHESLRDFIEYYGYDSLEDLLIDNFGINNPEEYILKITSYYNAIKPGDIVLIGYNLTPVVGYMNAIIISDDEREYSILTKF